MAKSDCPVEFFLIEENNGRVELGLRNNMSEPHNIQYDRLPWVLSSGGVEFHVSVDGKRIQQVHGVGRNTLILKLGPKSSISSEVDIGYLSSLYSGISIDRVSIAWEYGIPNSEIFEKHCRRFEGVLKSPPT
ncbi:hypothetical protein [Comamonas koreensis]|uniref:hypothetical protein n=1 Tax=Comamonas koreensis TaxID=160825 RepID=UPI0015FBC595|nr:hypothetical protein [Comamonas koreensis]